MRGNHPPGRRALSGKRVRSGRTWWAPSSLWPPTVSSSAGGGRWPLAVFSCLSRNLSLRPRHGARPDGDGLWAKSLHTPPVDSPTSQLALTSSARLPASADPRPAEPRGSSFHHLGRTVRRSPKDLEAAAPFSFRLALASLLMSDTPPPLRTPGHSVRAAKRIPIHRVRHTSPSFDREPRGQVHPTAPPPPVVPSPSQLPWLALLRSGRRPRRLSCGRTQAPVSGSQPARRAAPVLDSRAPGSAAPDAAVGQAWQLRASARHAC